MEENEEKLEGKKSFWKSKKNIAIVILSVLLFFSIGNGGGNKTTENTLTNEVARLTDQVKVLEVRNEKLAKSLNEVSLEVTDTTDYKSQISSLETQVAELVEKNTALEKELDIAKEENEKLSNDLKSKSTVTSTKSTTVTNASTSAPVTQTQSTSATTSTQVESSVSNSYTVYVTNTGAKYHRAGCRYLRQSQNPISKDDAVAQGYTPCSVCNP